MSQRQGEKYHHTSVFDMIAERQEEARQWEEHKRQEEAEARAEAAFKAARRTSGSGSSTTTASSGGSKGEGEEKKMSRFQHLKEAFKSHPHEKDPAAEGEKKKKRPSRMCDVAGGDGGQIGMINDY